MKHSKEQNDNIEQIKNLRRNGYSLDVIFEKIIKNKSLIQLYKNPFLVIEETFDRVNKNDFIDMTSKTWCNLSIKTQQDYSSNYQSWYARQVNQDIEKTFIVRGAIFKMLLVPPGKFISSTRKNEKEKKNFVLISSPFWCGETVVTQQQYQAIMKKNYSHFKDNNKPVENVSFQDCQQFIEKTDFDLLTSEEWEYACRSGITTPYSFGETITTEQANFDGNFPCESEENSIYRAETVRVKSFPPNSFGLYEMHGNVWEICLDSSNIDVAIKGGSWYSNSESCKADKKNHIPKYLYNDDIGFRLKIIFSP